MNNKYHPIIHNTIPCGEPAERMDAIIAERMDTIMEAVHLVEHGQTQDADLIAAVTELENTLRKYADNGDVESCRICRSAERHVLNAFAEVKKTEVKKTGELYRARIPRLTNTQHQSKPINH